MATPRPGEVDLDEQRIAVAVHSHLPQSKLMAGGLTLDPELLAAAAEEGYVAGTQSLLVSLLVHIPEHQHLAGVPVLHDDGHQTVLELELHLRVLLGCK